MGRAQNIGAYTDIRLQLEELRKLGGGVVEHSSNGRAINWMARVYMYRKLLRNGLRIGMPEGYDPATPWDDIIMTHIKGSLKVTVQFGVVKRGTISSLPDAPELPANTTVDPLPDMDLDSDLVSEMRRRVEEEGQ